MYKKLCVFLLIAAMLLVMPACGKHKQEGDALKQSETIAENDINLPETEKTTEETKEISTAKVVIEYSMPAGESVERAEDNEFDDSQDHTEEIKGAENSAETVSPVAIEKEDCGCGYSNYAKMSPAEQEEYMNSFATPLDFIEWSKNALAEHEAHDTTIQASGGDLDISDYIK